MITALTVYIICERLLKFTLRMMNDANASFWLRVILCAAMNQLAN